MGSRVWEQQMQMQSAAPASAQRTVEGVPTDAHHSALPQALVGRLEHGLVGERACVCGWVGVGGGGGVQVPSGRWVECATQVESSTSWLAGWQAVQAPTAAAGKELAGRTRPRHDANLAGRVDVAGHDANFALPCGGHGRAGAV